MGCRTQYLAVLPQLAGAFPGLPKYTPAVVTRSGKSECAAYLDLASAYAKGAEDVRKALTTHMQAFTDVGCSVPLLSCSLPTEQSTFKHVTKLHSRHALLVPPARRVVCWDV